MGQEPDLSYTRIGLGLKMLPSL